MSEPLAVTLVTQNATADTLTDDTYLAILRSLVDVDGMSFQKLADATGYASKAWWNLRYHGKRPLDEEGKNALRKISEEFPPQPPSVTAVTDAMIHPDAAMYLVGELEPGERVRRVLMVAGSDAVTVYANGTVEAVLSHADSDMAKLSAIATDAPVTAVTLTQGAKREKDYRPRLSLEVKERIMASGATVEQLIEAGLQAMEGRE